MSYQPKTGRKCSCRRGIERDNCAACEGTGYQIDFAAIRHKNAAPADGSMRTTCAVAQMGMLLAGNDQKSQNDWKLRMLKAGLEVRGLDIPADWDQLSEDEKTRRLDKVIAAGLEPAAKG